MATFKLNVEIAPNQLTILKKSGFHLCVAKQVNGVYTVVWSGTNDYLVNQTFEWDETYQVFGEKKFEVGALVKASTNAAHIKFGQTSTLTEEGVMGEGKGAPDRSGVFNVRNEFGLICIGVNGKIGGDMVPIFVSPTVVAGEGKFEPVNSMKVWFSIKQKTSTMIFDWDTEGIEVTYSGTTDRSIKYAGKDGFGEWSLL